jgi:hypothetical protein
MLMVTVPSLQSGCPTQPVNLEPLFAVAVIVTTVSGVNRAPQVVPQSMSEPAVTMPSPVPPLLIVSSAPAIRVVPVKTPLAVRNAMAVGYSDEVTHFTA